MHKFANILKTEQESVVFLHTMCLIELLPENNSSYTHIQIGTIFTYVHTQVF